MGLGMTVEIDIEDLDQLRASIRRGEVCEITTIQNQPTTASWGVRRPWWGQAGRHRKGDGCLWQGMIILGAVLVFVSIVGLGSIGGYLWLGSLLNQ